MAFDCDDDIWGDRWSGGCTFTVYDQYGNSGKFTARLAEGYRNTIAINS